MDRHPKNPFRNMLVHSPVGFCWTVIAPFYIGMCASIGYLWWEEPKYFWSAIGVALLLWTCAVFTAQRICNNYRRRYNEYWGLTQAGDKD